MCNLYTMTASVDELRRVFGAFQGDTANLPPFDEIYPGKPAPVLRRGDNGQGLKLEMMEWGFPGLAAAKSRPVTNVRNLDSPFWRGALNRADRRCLVPVTRFCEWTAEADPLTRRKSKVWFGLHDDADPLFAFAGVWRPGPERPYMALLTCEPNSIVGAVHPKAMPVMLRREDMDRWLDHERVSACELARAYDDGAMRRLA
ncbi:MAG: SOS response-associated peptidase [Sphingomicrobium sp.]|nr:SOS response-associated peptidase [Sphingomonadales bacterium]